MLRAEQVGRQFPNGAQALQSVSLQVAQGDFIALLGPSGCGKSTLLRLLAGLDEPDTGHIDRAALDPLDIGVVFQDPTLLPWATAAENVGLPLRLRGHKPGPAAKLVADTLARMGLQGFEHARPRQLSGGMRMRVSIARSLVAQPRLLLMDEPFAALDEFTRHALQDDLRRLWAQSGCSVVFVTHSIYEAAYLARRIIVMTPRPGRIASEIASNLPEPGAETTTRRLDPAYAALVAEITEALRRANAA